ncbi:MAG TPA: hypothetical protein VHD33_00665 [Legionellaceae bacterium]|nr:hypothetical protein [Legionellaceae bacterium]
MSSVDTLQRPLDAQLNNIVNLGDPQAPTDATHVGTDLTQISEVGTRSKLGTSYQAAPLDHTHPAEDNISLRELQRKFRILLMAYIDQGFDMPIGLENEYELAIIDRG